jgi:hypothetical protein
MTFNVMATQDGLRNPTQDSYAVGVINQLDQPLFAALERRHGFSMQELSFDQSEQMKQDLYQGKSHTLLTKQKGMFDVGGESDRDLLNQFAEQFARQIWAEVGRHVDQARPDEVRFTGGGSLIVPVVEFLRKSLEPQRIKVVSSGREPSERVGAGWWRVWDNTGEKLVRLATAVGGASVILQAPQEPSERIPARVIRIPEPVKDYVSCSCHCANKDCARCGGRGYHRRID